jgi:hypothetical protein
MAGFCDDFFGWCCRTRGKTRFRWALAWVEDFFRSTSGRWQTFVAILLDGVAALLEDPK